MKRDHDDILSLFKALNEATTSDVDESIGDYKVGDVVKYDMLGEGSLTVQDLHRTIGAARVADRTVHQNMPATITEADGGLVSRYSVKFEDGYTINGVTVNEIAGRWHTLHKVDDKAKGCLQCGKDTENDTELCTLCSQHGSRHTEDKDRKMLPDNMMFDKDVDEQAVKETLLDISGTEMHKWFERDRAHVELRNAFTEDIIVEWWDEEVAEAVEDGFLDPKAYHESAYEYAASRDLLPGAHDKEAVEEAKKKPTKKKTKKKKVKKKKAATKKDDAGKPDLEAKKVPQTQAPDVDPTIDAEDHGMEDRSKDDLEKEHKTKSPKEETMIRDVKKDELGNQPDHSVKEAEESVGSNDPKKVELAKIRADVSADLDAAIMKMVEEGVLKDTMLVGVDTVEEKLTAIELGLKNIDTYMGDTGLNKPVVAPTVEPEVEDEDEVVEDEPLPRDTEEEEEDELHAAVESVNEEDKEADNFNVIGRGIVDRKEADDLARDKQGMVITDDKDDEKWMVIVKDDKAI